MSEFEMQYTERPPGMGSKGVCRLVRGNTMGGIVNGSLVFYEDDRTPPSSSLVGELVVAEVKGGRDLPYVRFLELGSRPGLYTLRSVTGDPMVDVELEWAEAAKWIRLPTPSKQVWASMSVNGTEHL